jgi:hypothetical protein
MQILWILLTCAVSVLVFMSTESLVSRVQFSRSWRIAFWTLSILGIGLGIRLVSLRYLKSPTLRLYGFPFPIAGGEYMNGKWLDGLVGNPLAFIADVGCAVAACLLPLLLAALVARRRRGQHFENISTA